MFDQCVNKLRDDPKHWMNNVTKNTAVKIKRFEQVLNCSGFCHQPSFWLSKNFSNGPPKNRCVRAMLNKF